jgi:hypothetical protein
MTRATRLIATLAVVQLLALACACRDDCDRAVARLQRIEAALAATTPTSARRPADPGRGLNPLLALSPAERTSRMTAECHDAKSAAYDPALACALRARSDAAAETCIAAMLRDVVHESTPVRVGDPDRTQQRN